MQRRQAREKVVGSGHDQHHHGPGRVGCFATKLDNGRGSSQEELSRLFKACASLSSRPSVFTPCSGSALQLHYLENRSYIWLLHSLPLLVRPSSSLIWCLGIPSYVVSLPLPWPPQSLPPIDLLDFQNLNYIVWSDLLLKIFQGGMLPALLRGQVDLNLHSGSPHLIWPNGLPPPTSLISCPTPPLAHPTSSHTGLRALKPQNFGTPFPRLGGLFTNTSRDLCVTSFRSLTKYQAIREALLGYHFMRWTHAHFSFSWSLTMCNVSDISHTLLISFSPISLSGCHS